MNKVSTKQNIQTLIMSAENSMFVVFSRTLKILLFSHKYFTSSSFLKIRAVSVDKKW